MTFSICHPSGGFSEVTGCHCWFRPFLFSGHRTRISYVRAAPRFISSSDCAALTPNGPYPPDTCTTLCTAMASSSCWFSSRWHDHSTLCHRQLGSTLQCVRGAASCHQVMVKLCSSSSSSSRRPNRRLIAQAKMGSPGGKKYPSGVQDIGFSLLRGVSVFCWLAKEPKALGYGCTRASNGQATAYGTVCTQPAPTDTASLARTCSRAVVVR